MKMQVAKNARLLVKMGLQCDKKWCNKTYSVLTVNNRKFEKSAFLEYTKIISQNTGLNYKEILSLANIDVSVFHVPKATIIENFKICKGHNIELNKTINDLNFLKLDGDDLENRILLLKEMGARRITTRLLTSMAGQTRMLFFKAFTGIPEDVDVAKNLYSYLHEPPAGVPPPEPLSTNLTVKNYQMKCLSHYIQWRLEVPENPKLLGGLVKKLKFKSFARLKDSFDVLHNDYGVSIKDIRERNCLGKCLPIDSKRILHEVKTICNLPVRDLWVSNPILFQATYNNVVSVKKLLEHYEFSGEQLKLCPKILLISEEYFKAGVQMLESTPELSVLFKHPHVLRILMSQDRTTNRMMYLSYLNVKDVPVNLLASPEINFDRPLSTLRYKKKEIHLILKGYFQSGVDEIENELHRHPCWQKIDLSSIHETLRYLRTLFELEDIKNNIQLVLYNKAKIKSIMDKLMLENQNEPQSNRYTQSQLMALCAYEIEKKHNFTGDGVWPENTEENEIRNNCIENCTESQPVFPSL